MFSVVSIRRCLGLIPNNLIVECLFENSCKIQNMRANTLLKRTFVYYILDVGC
jgi:hypothetical protein